MAGRRSVGCCAKDTEGDFQMIVINFKNYKTGKVALGLARKAEKHLPSAIVCVDFFDVKEISSKTNLKVYAQHVDSSYGNKSTGFVVPEVLKKAGCEGSLLNHSEHRISFDMIEKTIKHAHRIGLKIILCVSNLGEAKKFKFLKPYAMALEDKKLIGSGKSITNYRSDEVEKFAKFLKGSEIKSLCGAGISSVGDVIMARELGCDGVLIASAIANSKKPEKLLKELKNEI